MVLRLTSAVAYGTASIHRGKTSAGGLSMELLPKNFAKGNCLFRGDYEDVVTNKGTKRDFREVSEIFFFPNDQDIRH